MLDRLHKIDEISPNGRTRRRLIIITIYLALALIVPIITAQPHQASTTTVTYQLGWDWGTAVPDEHGDGWTMTNDLGYQIHVAEGHLLTYSAELLPCENTLLRRWLMPQTAHAGHGEAISEARTTQPQLESLNQPTAVFIETRTIAATSYCELHYLIGPHAKTADNSLTITGSSTTHTDTAVSFTFQTDLAWGIMIPLPTELRATDTAVTIILQRDLSRLFDSIDFENGEKTDIEKALLRNIINSTEIVMFSNE